MAALSTRSTPIAAVRRLAWMAVWLMAGWLLAGWPGLARAGDATATLQAAWGDWRVTSVKIDDSRSGRLIYGRDAPQLIGKKLHIGPDAIRSDLPERRACTEPALIPAPLALDELLRDTMPSAADHPEQSYRLPEQAGTTYALGWLRCGTGRFGPALPPRDASGPEMSTKAPAGARTWILVRRDGQQALLRWYDATLLVLTPANR